MIIWIALTLTAVAWALWFNKHGTSVGAYSSDDERDAYITAALDLGNIVSGDTICGYSPREAESARKRAASYRVRAESIKDPKWRLAHLGWVEYSERNIRESEEAWQDLERVRVIKSANPLAIN